MTPLAEGPLQPGDKAPNIVLDMITWPGQVSIDQFRGDRPLLIGLFRRGERCVAESLDVETGDRAEFALATPASAAPQRERLQRLSQPMHVNAPDHGFRNPSVGVAGDAAAGELFALADGVIYRVRYTGGAPGAKTAAAAPAGPMQEQAGRGADVPLAQARAETAQSGDAPALQVKSAAFGDGQPIPLKHSAYDHGASFPLSWSAAPAGTRSYAIILEDPDVTRPPKPVIHWIAWNIPADVSALREGLPPQDRLTDPDGLRQGPNTPGRTGYYGPRPPAGDTPHRYHTQVFALDRMLDLPAGADREALLAAMRGHVLAKGVLVGTFARPAEPKRP